ncbi:MAG: prolyl oligopeptidase family serine peptidase [Gammaproteobacteria bacterium]|nr:prolyl oligopeptidase family serine peptidase [Gammaproteobacteria bacterium]
MARIAVFALAVPFLLSLAGCPQDSDSGPPPGNDLEAGWHKDTLRHDGLERVFRYYVPQEAQSPMPVVVVLHGGTSSMDTIFDPDEGRPTLEWVEIAEEEDAVLLVPNGTNTATGAPQGNDQSWNDCRPGTGDRFSEADDVGFINALLDWSIAFFSDANHPIDTDRIYVTGASNGGMMTYRLITELPERFAAAAAFIANRPAGSECPQAVEPTPLLIVNGTADPFMPWDGGSIVLGGGPVLSAEETRDYWIGVNNASIADQTITSLPDLDTADGSHIVCEAYPPTPSVGGAPVRFCRVEGGGHSMPSIEHQLSPAAELIVGPQNHDIEGARFAWAFLEPYLADMQ